MWWFCFRVSLLDALAQRLSRRSAGAGVVGRSDGCSGEKEASVGEERGVWGAGKDGDGRIGADDSGRGRSNGSLTAAMLGSVAEALVSSCEAILRAPSGLKWRCGIS